MLLYSQLGYYINGKITQYQLQQTIKERVWRDAPDSCFKAVVLSGNEKDIRWEEEGREFSLKGMMYDVVRTKIINGQTILLCVNDTMEDALLQQINDITKNNHQHNSRDGSEPGGKLLYDAIFPDSLHCLNLCFRRAPIRIHYAVALSSQPALINLQPPRFI